MSGGGHSKKITPKYRNTKFIYKKYKKKATIDEKSLENSVKKNQNKTPQ